MDSTQYWSDKYISACTNAANILVHGNTKKSYEICSKLTIKTLEQRQRRRYSLFTVNFEPVNVSWEPYFDTKANACQRNCQHNNLSKGIFISK